MKPILALVLSALLPLPALAESAADSEAEALIRPAGDAKLEDFRWHKRPIVVFSDSPENPLFIEQIEWLEEDAQVLRDRDVVVLADSDPAALSPLREKLRPRGFMLVLIGKDGTVLLRKPLPSTVRELTRSIDKLPSRQREVEERRGS